MTADRFDDLLARALAAGAIPPEATEDERARLASLLQAGAVLEQAGARTHLEASAAMPAARARFERFLAGERQRALPAAPPRPRRGFLGRILHPNRGLLLAGGAVAVGLIAIVGVFAGESLVTGTDTASAQVLMPNDYVQVQGVVKSITPQGSTTLVELQSEFADVKLVVSPDTSVVNGSGGQVSDIKAGEMLLVGGLVNPDQTVAAQTVAVSAQKQAAPQQSRLQALKKFMPNLQGRVILLAVSKDGSTARVLIQAPNGTRYIVNVYPRTAERLLTASSTVIGANVLVSEGEVPNDGIFALSESATPAAASGCPVTAATSRPAFVGVCGVIAARMGNVIFVIDANRVTHRVVITAQTRFLLGESGLTRASVREGKSVVGHTIAVTGGYGADGRVIANVVVVGKLFSPAR